MDYKQGYLHIFNRLTDIIRQIETMDNSVEWVDIAMLLKQLQIEAEEQCIN